jgi:centrosomal protein CEP41
MDSVSVAAG